MEKKRDLSMRNGIKPMPDPERVRPIQAQNEDLKRRLFGKLTEAEQDAKRLGREIVELKALPDHIRQLATRLSKTPFQRWTPQDMAEVEKYFTPDQAHAIAEASQKNVKTRE
jgi:hypothetical protein